VARSSSQLGDILRDKSDAPPGFDPVAGPPRIEHDDADPDGQTTPALVSQRDHAGRQLISGPRREDRNPGPNPRSDPQSAG